MAERDYNPALIRETDWGRALDERFVLQWLKDHVTGYLVDGKTYHPADVTMMLRSPTGAPNPVARAHGEVGHRRQVAEEIAQAIEAYDGPLTDGPRTTLARIARAHGETGHG